MLKFFAVGFFFGLIIGPIAYLDIIAKADRWGGQYATIQNIKKGNWPD